MFNGGNRRRAFLDEERTRTRPWETARRVLQAAAVEAHGRPGAYVAQDRVMQRASIVDTEHFRTIARYLEEQGWIAQADAEYGVLVVTASGIAEATG
jgi:hypothetical protein